VSVYDQDVDPLALGPFTVNQFNLSGLIDSSDLTSKGITISNATVEVHQNDDSPSLLGNASVNSWSQSWSFGILTEETSLPVRIVLRVGTSNGRTIYDEILTTLTAGRSDLNFKPGPVSAEETINGVGVNNGYSYLFVPDTPGVYIFNVSAASSQQTRLYLYDASGTQLDSAYGYQDAVLSYNLTAGTAYYIQFEQLYNNYLAFQFRVDPVSQANLGGTVNFNGLLSPFSGEATVDSAEITIYADNNVHTQLGTPASINTDNGSWSAAVDLAGSSAPAVFVITANLSNGITVYEQVYSTISGDNSSLNFSAAAVTGLNPVTRTTINQEDYLLYVPGTTGDYSLRISADADRYMNFNLYDTQTGYQIGSTSGSGELELIQTLTAGNPYPIRVYSSSSSFETYQFQAENLQPVTLSGTVNLGGLPPLISGNINHTEIQIYGDASNLVQLGSVMADNNGIWSTTIPVSGSRAVRIVANIVLNNGRTIITHQQATINGNTFNLDLTSTAVSPASGQLVPRVSSTYGSDSFLLVPSAGDFFNLGAISSDGMSNPYLYLYDAATGDELARSDNGPLYTVLIAGTPYIVSVNNIGPFMAYQFRMSALASASIGGSVDYSNLHSSISSLISSATVSGYLEPSHTQIVSGAPVPAGGGAWSASIPSSAVGQTIRLVLTLNLSNGRTINSHIQRVLSAPAADLDFAPTAIASETTMNSKTTASGYDSFLFVPAAGGNFALQSWSDTSININVYDGLTGHGIANSSSYLSATAIASLSSGNPYIVQVYLNGYSFRDYQFYAGPPATLGGTVSFSGLTAWSPDSAAVLAFTRSGNDYNVLGTGTVSLSGGAWSISDLPPSGEVFTALVGLSTGGEGVLATQTVSVSGNNNAIDFSPGDSDKNVATGTWHNRSVTSDMETWLLWIPGASGEYMLDTERTGGSVYPYMFLYDGLTGVRIDYSYGGENSRIQRADFEAGHPYLIRVWNTSSGSGSFQFKAEAVAP
jgi:hypothetical protein